MTDFAFSKLPQSVAALVPQPGSAGVSLELFEGETMVLGRDPGTAHILSSYHNARVG